MRLDCASCEHGPPRLWAENEQALRLWGEIQTQWRATGFGVVGMDWPAAFAVARVLRVPVTERLFKKLRALERAELEHMAETAKDEN